MQKLQLLARFNSHETIHIAENDMIHLRWKHVTICLNVTGLIYLVDYLNGDRSLRRPALGFEIKGTLDDGYQLWIQDVGLRLSHDDFQRFRQLVNDGLALLRQLGKQSDTDHLPDYLKLTLPAATISQFSSN